MIRLLLFWIVTHSLLHGARSMPKYSIAFLHTLYLLAQLVYSFENIDRCISWSISYFLVDCVPVALAPGRRIHRYGIVLHHAIAILTLANYPTAEELREATTHVFYVAEVSNLFLYSTDAVRSKLGKLHVVSQAMVVLEFIAYTYCRCYLMGGLIFAHFGVIRESALLLGGAFIIYSMGVYWSALLARQVLRNTGA